MTRNAKLLTGDEFDVIFNELSEVLHGDEETISKVFDIFHNNDCFAIISDEQAAEWEGTPDHICEECSAVICEKCSAVFDDLPKQ